ncbi:SGNH/GDSL hydrolase family protein [Chromobacterium sp. CV08]|uniref:SGNH/GDSL hydrolase family protein n=1 Tax=Chromobacterium sp. CV08 TaxID=3133274 RepID=UPI003DA87319
MSAQTRATELGARIRQVRHDVASPARHAASHGGGGAADRPGLFDLAVRDQQIRGGQCGGGLRTENGALAHVRRLVVIGDSLSDSEGRMWKKTCGIMPSSRQYYDGRFTNGFVWTDFLASRAFLDKELVNYAEGGAVAGKYSKLNPVFLFISHMERQIDKHDFRPGDMAVLALGSNDYMTFGKTDVGKVMRSYQKQIDRLVDKGVTDILVLGVPDLSKTAYARTQPQAYRDTMQALSRQHNDELRQKIAELNDSQRGKQVAIRFFDTAGELDGLMSLADEIGYDTRHPNHEGYIDLPRVIGLAGDRRPLDTAPRRLFHDTVHPSQEAHQILASRMADFIREQFGREAPAG